MKVWWRFLMLALLGLALMMNGSGMVVAQVATTTVEDTVYLANGTPAAGQVLVSWGSFTTVNGAAVPAGSTSATIGAGGVVSVALVPNAGSTPMGSYYTAVFHLSDGTISKEYWVVPVTVPGGGPAKLAAIRNEVLPASVAMQTVSKAYVDHAIAQAQIPGLPLDSSPYVAKAGDTMTGPLVLPGDPATPDQAANKEYVDSSVASVSGGVAGKVSELPSATQVVTQPSGTQLETNDLNGVLYATQYVNNAGQQGIAGALASAACASGCKIVVEPTYPASNDFVDATAAPSGTHEVDERNGSEVHAYTNPRAYGNEYSGTVMSQLSTQSIQQIFAQTGEGMTATTMDLRQNALTGGENQLPLDQEKPPYFRSNYNVLAESGTYNTEGQHITTTTSAACYSVGDCIAETLFVTASGGYHDPSDEGTHLADRILQEDKSVFQGTCTTGCATGATSLFVTSTAGAGSQGDGRFLIDTTPAKVIQTGALVGGDITTFGRASFSGTNFATSVFLTGTTAELSQPNNMAPGTVTVAIATSGVAAGYATNTAALPGSTGIACVADPTTVFPQFETAPYTVVDGTHVQLTLRKVHAPGFTIAVGGLCGYGLEETVDTTAGIRQVFPVVGSTGAQGLFYADAGAGVVGIAYATGGYLNLQLSVASVVRSKNVITVTIAGSLNEDVNGLTMTVSGVADASYNGSYVVTTTSGNTLTYANTGPDSTSSGGTVSYLTGGYALYPMAEVVSVFNAANKKVDGTLTLAPNAVAWAAGDTVEQPHYHVQLNGGDDVIVEQTMPRPRTYETSSLQYEGLVGSGLSGFSVQNAANENLYYGRGGTHTFPSAAYVASGGWNHDFDVDAGATAVLNVGCNPFGCGSWNSGYSLFRLQSSLGYDSLDYAPQSKTATWNIGGQQYIFSPTAFTAATINVGTLNATTIAGGVSAGAISSGTISPARLPVFGPSGTTHAVGAVPDPGAVTGNTRFLREDGTWTVPSGSGSGSGGSPTGSAGGDLSGSYPNPVVAAVHAVSGSLNGVTIGAATAAAGTFTNVTATSNAGPGFSTGFTEIFGTGNTTTCNLCTYIEAGRYFGQGQTFGQVTEVSSDGSSADSFALYLNKLPDMTGNADNSDLMWQSGMGSMSAATFFGWSAQGNGFAGTAADTLSLRVGFSSPAAGVVSLDTTSAGNALGSLRLNALTTTALRTGVATNTDVAGTLTLAAGSTASASYSFAGTYASAPVCLVQPQNVTPGVVAALNSFSAQVSATTLSVAVGSAPGTAVTFGYVCAARN